MSREGFRLNSKLGTANHLARVKRWCKKNKVPYSRLMNHVLIGLSCIEEYSYKDLLEISPQLVVYVDLPPQVNVENQWTYLDRKDKDDKDNSRS
jgi:predicted nucleotidyltransferase